MFPRDGSSSNGEMGTHLLLPAQAGDGNRWHRGGPLKFWRGWNGPASLLNTPILSCKMHMYQHVPPRKFFSSHQVVADTRCSHFPLLLRAEQTALSLSLHIKSSRRTIQLLLCLLCVLGHHELPPFDPNLAEITSTWADSTDPPPTRLQHVGTSFSPAPFSSCRGLKRGTE